MFGLKSYLPILARHLNTTDAVLYERQKKLTQAGRLIGTAGRGPGSGIRVNAPNVALLVMAIMATDNLADVVACVEMIESKKSDKQRCPLTGASTAGSALELIFASESVASSVQAVTVRRSWLDTKITFRPRPKVSIETTSFGWEWRPQEDPGRHVLQIEAHLPGEAVKAISSDLAAVAAGKRLSLAAKGAGE